MENKISNKGITANAQLREQRTRYELQDPALLASLQDHYEYLTKYLDPILSKAIEEVLLYQPDQTAEFLAQYLRGTLDLKKFNYVAIKRHQYYDRKLRHLLAHCTTAAVKDRPEDLQDYLAEFFEARIKFY